MGPSQPPSLAHLRAALTNTLNKQTGTSQVLQSFAVDCFVCVYEREHFFLYVTYSCHRGAALMPVPHRPYVAQRHKQQIETNRLEHPRDCSLLPLIVWCVFCFVCVCVCVCVCVGGVMCGGGVCVCVTEHF